MAKYIYPAVFTPENALDHYLRSVRFKSSPTPLLLNIQSIAPHKHAISHRLSFHICYTTLYKLSQNLLAHTHYALEMEKPTASISLVLLPQAASLR